MSTRLALTLGAVVWSVLVWTALWSDLSLANVLFGALVGVLLVRIVPVPERPDAARISPVWALVYVANLLWELVKSSSVVAWEVVTPKNRINQAIVAVPLRTTSDVVTTVVANSISLTPGTLTLEIATDPTVLYVHIMHLRSIDEVREGVLRLEDLALRAFPGAPALDAVPDPPDPPDLPDRQETR